MASCALDCFLEVFHYGIWLKDPNIACLKAGLLGKVNTCSHHREALGMPIEELREEIWDYLVEECNGFRPKGTCNAETMDAFRALGTHEDAVSKFNIMLNGTFSCPACLSSQVLDDTTPSVLILTQSVGSSCHGSLTELVENQIATDCRSWLCRQTCCSGMPLTTTGHEVYLPDFLHLELGIVDGKNKQQPALAITQVISVFGVTYVLTAAVQLTAGHFWSIVKANGKFYVLDDLKLAPLAFDTFPAAVCKDRHIQDEVHVTSPDHAALHILVYMRHDCTNVPGPTLVDISPAVERIKVINRGRSRVRAFPVAQVSPNAHAQAKRTLPTNSGPTTADQAKPTTTVEPPKKISQAKCQDFSESKVAGEVEELSESVILNESAFKPMVFSTPLSQTDRAKTVSQSSKAKKALLLKSDTITPKLLPSPTNSSPAQQKANTNKVLIGEVTIKGEQVAFRSTNGVIYLECRAAWNLIGIQKHLKKEGFKYIDRHLEKFPCSQDKFLMKGTERQFVSLQSYILLLDMQCVKSTANANLKTELFRLLGDELCIGIHARNQLSKKKKKHIVSKFSLKEIHSRPVRATKTRKLSRRNKLQHLKQTLEKVCVNTFGNDTNAMFRALGDMVRCKPLNKTPEGQWVPTIDHVCHLLETTKGKSTLMTQVLKSPSAPINKLSAEDVIHLQGNYSGTRLIEQLRKKLPHQVVGRRAEQKKKTDYKTEMYAVLLPRETKSGWMIDPDRLLEVLQYKFYFLRDPKHWRMYGDGREIGGRKSCFLSISPINSELYLHGFLFQSPNEVFPIAIFYEGDNRENIEENIGYKLDQFVSRHQGNLHNFFMTGDEMFLEAILDCERKLSPTSEDGWNIYHPMKKEEKSATCPSTGLRLDMDYKIDREHPTSLLSSIPIGRFVMCVLHGKTRIVERLISLEIDNILNRASQLQQTKQDGVAWRDEKLSNLESNINKRGVRQGNFQILFDKKGAPEKVSLNKDHAMSIICEQPESETRFPHVLNNVVSEEPVQKQLAVGIQQKLHLQNQYTQLQLVKEIWHHFDCMMKIMQQDPLPCLLPGKLEGSQNPADFKWGYTEEDIEQYRYHAECYYQLFILRYSYAELTPYMMKFIDHVPELMKTLPFPLARYQTEAGEHANYQHNRYYFQHTTRHGGSAKSDPILGIFGNMWECLRHSITVEQDGSEDAANAATAFSHYCNTHVAATVINRTVRMHLTRQKLKRAGWIWPTTTDEDRRGNKEAVARYRLSSQACEQICQQSLSGQTVVLIGAIPKSQSGKKYTQEQLGTLVKQLGGRIRPQLPKKATTHSYVVLTTQAVVDKAPTTVKESVRRGYQVLDFSYVVDLSTGQNISKDNYVLTLGDKYTSMSRKISVGQKHFSKKKTMISIMKGTRRKRYKPLVQTICKMRSGLGVNAAQYYAFSKRTEQLNASKTRPTFSESRQILCDYFHEWNMLPSTEKMLYVAKWQAKKLRIQSAVNIATAKRERLKNYNKLEKTAYQS